MDVLSFFLGIIIGVFSMSIMMIGKRKSLDDNVIE